MDKTETPDQRAAAEKRKAAAEAAPQRDRVYLSALEVERRGYVVRDLPDRVAQVDAEIERVKALIAASQAAATDDAPPAKSTAKKGRASAQVAVDSAGAQA